MITDRSGSMRELAADVRGGHNAYLDSLTGEDILITHITFNTEVQYLDRLVPIAQATRLDEENYQPMGGTALLDAVGDGLATFKVPEGDKGIVFIQTDGHENSSKEYGKAAVAALIEGAEAKGIAVIYAAAGPDAWEDRHSYGANSVMRTNSSAGTQASYDSYVVGTRSWAGGQSANSAEVTKLVADTLKEAESGSVQSDETSR